MFKYRSKLKKRSLIKRIFNILVIISLVILIYFANYYNIIPKRTYKGEDFQIETIYSSVDFNNNGLDDYTDILLGARKDAKNRPRYDGSYYEGGYPPDNLGVCTDVVWRAFKNAGYNLKEMVDLDIEERFEKYKNVEKIDKNIDFRRVKNLHTYFEEYSISLTTDTSDIGEWQPGDIVIFRNDKHIGIISDKRNKKGQPYVIHNGGQIIREEDYLNRNTVIGHYRFDASRIPDEFLIKWD